MPPIPKSLEVTLRALALYAKGLSQSKVSSVLKQKNFKASKSTIGNKLRAVLNEKAFEHKAVIKPRHKLVER